jgi:dihydrolipoamide dehydrogenase
LILATGSGPARLPIPGAELAITSHELFRLGADLPFPQQPVIVGGGYIGVEVASMLEHLGAKPTILEATAELLPGFDPDLASGLRGALDGRAVIRTEALVRAIDRVSGALSVRFEQGGETKSSEGDMVIMATGRHPVLPEGLAALGLDSEHAPSVDNRLQTQNARVYAPGDVNARSMLFHSAVRQSLVVAHSILTGGQPADRFNFDAVPMTVFAEPEAAEVGLGEQSAAERCPTIEVARYDYAKDARAQIRQEPSGFIKLVIDGRSGRLLGAQILGIDAAQLIAPLALAVGSGLGAKELANTAFPHPMLSEGIAAAARALAARPDRPRARPSRDERATDPERRCRLSCLYGLRQAPRRVA